MEVFLCQIQLNTNVLVSALITRNESSPTVEILRFLATRNIVPVYSEEIVKEYNEVLRRAKFKLPEKPFVVTPSELVEILKLDINFINISSLICQNFLQIVRNSDNLENPAC